MGLVMLLTGVPTAHAALIQNSFGLSAPHLTIAFDEHVFPSNSHITTEYMDMGVVFSPYAHYSPSDGTSPGGSNISNFEPNHQTHPFSMIFSTPQTALAFSLITQYPATTTFYAYLGGIFVESDTVTTGNSSNDFYGFNGIVFDQISISTTYAGGGTVNGTGPLLLDSLQFATTAVPEPETYLLVVVGLAGLLLFGRRGRPAFLVGDE